jgi:hypothetical protein
MHLAALTAALFFTHRPSPTVFVGRISPNSWASWDPLACTENSIVIPSAARDIVSHKHASILDEFFKL